MLPSLCSRPVRHRQAEWNSECLSLQALGLHSLSLIPIATTSLLWDFRQASQLLWSLSPSIFKDSFRVLCNSKTVGRVTWKNTYEALSKVVVQSLSRVRLFVTPWRTACQASLSFTVSWSLLKLVSIELMMTFNRLTLYRPLPLLLQCFTVSGSFAVSWLFNSGCQSIEASASSTASVPPMNIQDWFPLSQEPSTKFGDWGSSITSSSKIVVVNTNMCLGATVERAVY